MDSLDKIFEGQKELNKKLVPWIEEDLKTIEGKIDWIFKFKLAMDQEIAEMSDCLPWKWWSKNKPIDYQNLKVELVDILFFWTSICLSAGFSAKEMREAYFKKLILNHKRADNGYKNGTYSKYDENGIEDNRII